MFRMNMENAIPGSIILQIEFRDANNNIVFSLFDEPGVEVPSGGNNTSSEKRVDTYLTLEEIHSLRYVTQIYSYIHLNIQSLTKNVSYLPDQLFKLQMGFRVGLEIDGNDQPI